MGNLTHLTSFDISNNQYFGYQDDKGTQAIGKNLGKLTRLTSLNLNNNDNLGSKGDAGIEKIAQAFKNMAALKIFNILPANGLSSSAIHTLNSALANYTHFPLLPFTLTDSEAVKAYFSTVNQTATSFNFSGMIRDDVQGTTLTTLMKYLCLYNTTLTSLDLSNNPTIGYYNDNGTLAIGNSLGNFTRLLSLNLSNNGYLDSQGQAGIMAIGNSLQYLTRLTSLDLSRNGYLRGLISDTWVQAIGNSLQYLTSLNLSFTINDPQGKIGAQIIGNSLQYLTRLTSLDLSNNPYLDYISVNGTVAIGNSLQYLTRLTSLDLSNNAYFGVQGTGAQIISKNLQYLTRLTSLNLSNNGYLGIYDPRIQAIGNSLGNLTRLTSLDLGNILYLGYGGDNGTQAIGNSLKHLSQLTVFRLSGTGIGNQGDKGTQVIGNSLANLTRLTSLDLSNNKYLGYWSDAGTQVIGNSLGNLTRLTSLDLSNNPLLGSKGQAGVEAIEVSLQSIPPLKVFNIVPSNSLSAVQISQLTLAANHPVVPSSSVLLRDKASVLAYFQTVSPGLSAFQFPSNVTDDAAGTTLSTLMQSLSLYGETLTTLDLSHNDIGLYSEAGTLALSQALPNLPKLTYLDLSYNNIGYQGSNGSIVLGQSLSRLPSLINLNLGYNMIGYTGSQGSLSIVSAIPTLTHLQTLNLNNMTNIQWDQNLEEINSFTNRKLQEICESQRCHGTAIKPVKDQGDSSSDAESVTSAASSLQVPWPLKMIGSSVNTLKNGFVFSYRTVSNFMSDLPTLSPFSAIGQYLGDALDNVGESLKEVVLDSPSYFPNIHNNMVSDWQPNPLTSIGQPQVVNYTSLLPCTAPQPGVCPIAYYALS